MKSLLSIAFFIVVTVIPFLIIYPVYLYFEQHWILYIYGVLQIAALLFVANNKRVSTFLERKGVIKKEPYKGGA